MKVPSFEFLQKRLKEDFCCIVSHAPRLPPPDNPIGQGTELIATSDDLLVFQLLCSTAVEESYLTRLDLYLGAPSILLKSRRSVEVRDIAGHHDVRDTFDQAGHQGMARFRMGERVICQMKN